MFQLPGLVALLLLLLFLRKWIDLPPWAVWGLLAAWIAKDVLFFPFVWRSYLPPSGEDDRLIGESGLCKERLDPSGYVSVRGELWRAELKRDGDTRPALKGERVVVVGMRGLTLLVRRQEGGEQGAQRLDFKRPHL